MECFSWLVVWEDGCDVGFGFGWWESCDEGEKEWVRGFFLINDDGRNIDSNECMKWRRIFKMMGGRKVWWGKERERCGLRKVEFKG